MELCKRALELNLPLGYNLNGYVKNRGKNVITYPYDGFWRIVAETGCKVLIEYDAHNPKLLENNEVLTDSRKFLERIGCRVIDRLIVPYTTHKI